MKDKRFKDTYWLDFRGIKWKNSRYIRNIIRIEVRRSIGLHVAESIISQSQLLLCSYIVALFQTKRETLQAVMS